LDAILEWEMAQRQGKAKVINRHEPAPPVGEIHLPCLRGSFAGVDGIPRCSAPILKLASVRHEHFAKRISVENALMLSEDQRLIVATGNSWTKSYRLPLHVANVERICWFVGGAKRRNLKTLLKTVASVGKKRSQGYGRVSSWLIEEVEHDWSWFADAPEGQVLMRVLPWCESLEKAIGWKRWFGGFAPPYWHPDRMCDVACPV
jgi:hypothetical protein